MSDSTLFMHQTPWHQKPRFTHKYTKLPILGWVPPLHMAIINRCTQQYSSLQRLVIPNVYQHGLLFCLWISLQWALTVTSIFFPATYLSQEAKWHLQILSRVSVALIWSCMWGDNHNTSAEHEYPRVPNHFEHQNDSISWLYLDKCGTWEAGDRQSGFCSLSFLPWDHRLPHRTGRKWGMWAF